jgi:3-oxoacyl-[acyl-carrier protein] reductase
MDLGLADRVYVLTGASRGLGRATAECLVADGARVVVSGRTKATVDATVEALGAAHAAGAVADLGDPNTPDRLVSLAYERFGRLDGALISVGGPPRGTILGMPDEAWLGSFHSVFLGAVRMARTVATSLEPGGAIALVLSTSVRAPLPDLSISNALRPGLAGFAKDLSDEVGPRGIRIIALLPGKIMTDRNRELFEATDDPEAAAAQAAAAIPLRRIGQPEEFGRVAAFALSPAASYLSGISLAVDGGSTRAL